MLSALIDRTPRPPPERVARLSVGGPALVGYLVIALFFVGALGWAATATITKGATVPGSLIVESKTKPVQHAKGGNVRAVHVIDGQRVAKGDLLVTLDDAEIREVIKGAIAQIDGASNELAILRKEAGILRDLVQRQLAPRPRLAELERQIAQSEKEIAIAEARKSTAEQDLSRTEIRAPVTGRILTRNVTGRGAVVPPGGVVVEISPQSDRLVVEGKLAANDIEGIYPGMRAKVWLSALNRRESEPLKANLAWVAPDSVEEKQTGQAYYQIRVELRESREEIEKRVKLYPGMRTEILIVKGTSTILDRLLDPLMRGIGRAFRDH